MQITSYCFETQGPSNTDKTLEIALERAKVLGIQQVVVASSHGETARRAQSVFGGEGIKVVAVTLAHAHESLDWCMDEDTKEELHNLGIVTVTGIHALGGGVSSAFTGKFGGREPDEIVCHTLYRFSQGMKVAVEDVLMAADAGVLDMEQEVISIAGTSEGADTAIVCKPAYPSTFLELEIREVLAKPRIP